MGVRGGRLLDVHQREDPRRDAAVVLADGSCVDGASDTLGYGVGADGSIFDFVEVADLGGGERPTHGALLIGDVGVDGRAVDGRGPGRRATWFPRFFVALHGFHGEVAIFSVAPGEVHGVGDGVEVDESAELRGVLLAEIAEFGSCHGVADQDWFFEVEGFDDTPDVLAEFRHGVPAIRLAGGSIAAAGEGVEADAGDFGEESGSEVVVDVGREPGSGKEEDGFAGASTPVEDFDADVVSDIDHYLRGDGGGECEDCEEQTE